MAKGTGYSTCIFMPFGTDNHRRRNRGGQRSHDPPHYWKQGGQRGPRGPCPSLFWHSNSKFYREKVMNCLSLFSRATRSQMCARTRVYIYHGDYHTCGFSVYDVVRLPLAQQHQWSWGTVDGTKNMPPPNTFWKVPTPMVILLVLISPKNAGCLSSI